MKAHLEQLEKEKELKKQKKHLDNQIKLNLSQKPGSLLGTELKMDVVEEDDLEFEERETFKLKLDGKYVDRSLNHNDSSHSSQREQRSSGATKYQRTSNNLLLGESYNEILLRGTDTDEKTTTAKQDMENT